MVLLSLSGVTQAQDHTATNTQDIDIGSEYTGGIRFCATDEMTRSGK